MEEIELEQRLRGALQWLLWFLERDRRYVYVDWGQFRRAIEHLLPGIANLVL